MEKQGYEHELMSSMKEKPGREGGQTWKNRDMSMS